MLEACSSPLVDMEATYCVKWVTAAEALRPESSTIAVKRVYTLAGTRIENEQWDLGIGSNSTLSGNVNHTGI